MISPISLIVVVAQPGSPAIPVLAFDSFPQAARQVIEPAARAAAAKPTDAAALGALGRALHAWEQWISAHDAYARAAALAPRAFEWRYLDALVLHRLARHADAATRLREALSLSPDFLPARIKLAESLFESGSLDESSKLFLALVDEPQSRPAVEVGLGRIAAARGEHEAALAHFGRAATLFPELGAAHYGLALSYRALGRLEEARSALALHERYGARWPALVDPVLATVTTLREDAGAILQRGVRLADTGDLDGAIAAHEAALERDPALSHAHANLISLYGRAGNWSKAEDHYRAVVRSGSAGADAHYDYGVLMALQQKWDLAIDAYRQALAVNPMHAQARNNLGQALEQQRKFADAADVYRELVQSQPGFRLARFNLARMLIALGQPAEAAAELEKIVEPRDSEAPRYLFALGVAHLRAGRKTEGFKWSVEARQLALHFGQHDLAAAIDRDLAALKQQ
ncbi:MAG TPA: tetratricopeptide repeat protein [Vicinamibacterales bacterium]|nr:tetratricopeptide repeat protein [Vicinamibacterales bacterium]